MTEIHEPVLSARDIYPVSRFEATISIWWWARETATSGRLVVAGVAVGGRHSTVTTVHVSFSPSGGEIAHFALDLRGGSFVLADRLVLLADRRE